MDEAEAAQYFCHECTNEFSAAAQCPSCGSDFVERIEATDDPRHFARPNLAGWAWALGMTTEIPVQQPPQPQQPQQSQQSQQPQTTPAMTIGAFSTSENVATDESTAPLPTSNQATNESSTGATPSGSTSLSAQFEAMLHNLLSSIVGSSATVDIALRDTSERAEAPINETNRSQTGNFVFRRSFLWSNHPSTQNTNTSEHTDQPSNENVSQNSCEATSSTARENTETAGEDRGENSNQSTRTRHNTRTTIIPVHDLAAFLENAFGGGFPDDGTPSGSLGAFFSNVFAMRNPGDYVWSSSGFDNIITQLMEQHPSTNAPPPAPEEAINALPKTVVHEEDLQDCVICKENYQPEEIYITLPCKHYFHDNCIITWLKINNTCAICRTSIGTNVPHTFSSSEAENKERDDRSKDSECNMNDQLEQDPPD